MFGAYQFGEPYYGQSPIGPEFTVIGRIARIVKSVSSQVRHTAAASMLTRSAVRACAFLPRRITRSGSVD